jgi:hypothetical protein
VDQLLGARAPALSDEAKRLRERLGRDVNFLRLFFKQATGATAEARYASALLPCCGAQAQDPVLRYALARHEGLAAVADGLSQEAWDQYLRHPESYDSVLGAFLPEDFLGQARCALAQHAYVTGANLTAAADWDVYRDGLEQRRARPLRGLATGLPGLDAATGGLHGLTFLAGGAGTGKTTLALAAAVAALRRHPDVAVLFLSLDMPKERIYDRLLCQESGRRHAELIGQVDAQASGELAEAGERLRDQVLPRLRIVERRAFDPDQPLAISAMARQRNELLRASGAARALVVVDYFQLLGVPDSAGASLDADMWRVQTLQSLQAVGRGVDAPDGDAVLVISEVRKGEPGRPALNLSDLMGSARLGYAADAVWLLEPLPGAAADAEAVRVALTIAKGRDGVRRTRLELLFEHTQSRFAEVGATSRGRRPRQGPHGAAAAPPLDPLAGLGEGPS